MGPLMQLIYHRDQFPSWTLRNIGYEQNKPLERTDREPSSPRKGEFRRRHDLSEGHLVLQPGPSAISAYFLIACFFDRASNCLASIFTRRKKQPATKKQGPLSNIAFMAGRKQDGKVTVPVKERYISSQG